MRPILENPLVVREMRRMRFWERRASGTLALAVLCATAGIALPLFAISGVLSAPAVWQVWKSHFWSSYFILTYLATLLVLWRARFDRSDRAEEQIRLTRLRPEEIESGRIWGVVLPIAGGAAIGDLAIVTLPLLAPSGVQPGMSGFALVMCLHWLLLVSNLHFTSLIAMTGLRESGQISWGRVAVAVLSSHWLDLIIIGLVIKPVFLIMSLRDPLARRRLRD